jgi:GMP synthase (glutamine-hydrolysing)
LVPQADTSANTLNSGSVSTAQITVLDTGGQYTHLIARRVRELGVYADVQPSDLPAEQLALRKGVIISGGPGSVYEAGCPDVDPDLFSAGIPVLGICYGHQLIAKHLGGRVRKGERGEYGYANLSTSGVDPIFRGVQGSQIWMSHRDTVADVPPGFQVIGSSGVAGVAAMSDPARKIVGLQFHPEVVHTVEGRQILENFVFDIAGAVRDWDVSKRVPLIEEQIRSVVGDRSVFFFVSGGVDSTVAYTLCLRALGPERVWGIYVDTGLMRKRETEFVRGIFEELGARHFLVDRAEDEFLGALAGLHDPEAKRLAIGEQFVRVQERILATEHFLDGSWILGQGTIYPDTIESGGTAKADVIKTHHNRVAGIQALIESGRIVEPLTSFYKDEVREIGRELGLSERFLLRHPFPGPGLAIRCLCSSTAGTAESTPDGTLLPVKSVGVQGDSRSYRAVLALDRPPVEADVQITAPELTNRIAEINRVLALCGSKAQLRDLLLFEASISKARLDLLRDADAIVREFTLRTGFDARIWQMPVVLIPVGTPGARESIVLRPINSLDGMTADVVLMDARSLQELTERLLRLRGVAAVFYDLTHKPPGTIEWE